MKFENVKVGDTVFTERIVKYGGIFAEDFYAPEKVIRVTKTQFTVESGDRYKKDGNKIGDSFTRACFEGDDRPFFSNKEPICDETKKMKDFIHKLKLESSTNDVLKKIIIPLNSDLTNLELNNISFKLEEIHKIISSKNIDK